MEVINFDHLVATGKILNVTDVDPNEDYFIIGKRDRIGYKPYKATEYPIWAIKAKDVMAAFAPVPVVDPRLVLVKTTIDLNSTADQIITLPSGNFIIQNAYITNAPTPPLLATELTINTAANRIGDKLFTSADTLDWLNLLYSPIKYGPLIVSSCGLPPCNMHAVVSGTLYAKLTTPEGTPLTADLYIIGFKL